MNFLKAVNTAFLLLIVFFIASCSSLPEVVSVRPVEWQASTLQKNKIKDWSIKGRFSIQTLDNGGTFDIFWNQKKEAYSIRLIAPLGQGAFYIKGDSTQISIRGAKGLTQYSSNPKILIKQNLGIDLPLASLRQWMLGVPDNKWRIESQEWDEEGQLHRLEQAGWIIEMLRYKTVGDIALPHFFVLQRDDTPELTVRLIIRQWTLDE